LPEIVLPSNHHKTPNKYAQEPKCRELKKYDKMLLNHYATEDKKLEKFNRTGCEFFHKMRPGTLVNELKYSLMKKNGDRSSVERLTSSNKDVSFLKDIKDVEFMMEEYKKNNSPFSDSAENMMRLTAGTKRGADWGK
jgi:hypothetical protein